jgi:hypothetical protein
LFGPQTLSPQRFTGHAMRHSLRKHDVELLRLRATAGLPTSIRFARGRFDTPGDVTDARHNKLRATAVRADLLSDVYHD